MNLYDRLALDLEQRIREGVLRPGERLPSHAARLRSQRPSPATVLKAYYRVGWVAAGRYAQKIQRLKLSASLATTIPVQIALADFLRQGAFDTHLRRLRGALEVQEAHMAAAVERHFPPGTRLTRPRGGYFVWVELPTPADALALHRRALDSGISIAPGPICSAKREYRHCIRLNFGHPWSDRIEDAMARLGKMIVS